MKKINIEKQPKEIQVILSCICRKRQSDFLDKSIYQKKRKNADYKRELERDRQFIETLTGAIEHLNN